VLPPKRISAGFLPPNGAAPLDPIARAAYNDPISGLERFALPMTTGLQAVSTDRPGRRFRASGWAAVLLLLAGLAIPAAGLPDPAWARSSGGYSRPSSGAFKSFSTPSRRPPISSSGGYRRAPSAPTFQGSSPGDRAMSRGTSSDALRDYRAAQRPPAPPPTPPAGRPLAGGDRGWFPDFGWGSGMARRPSAWGPGWGGTATRRPAPGSGILTTVALWAALNALSSPGQAAVFREHRNDPVYREWREEAERTAARDPEIAAKLSDLDARMAQLDGQPGSAGGGPSGTAAPEDGSSWSVWGILFVIGGVVVLFWLWRRRAASPLARPGAAPGLGGSAESRFRVGMVMPVDSAPFLLAKGLTKVAPPDESGMVSIEAVGLLRYGGVLLHRLYLPGGKAFFQLHLGPDGRPDECRCFTMLDEVNPADPQEWGFWLDPGEGLIGWPTFQTKDGKVYGRVWGPGQTRIPPRRIAETRQLVDRTEQRQMQSMLYGAPIGGTPPAPETEYILVSALEAAGQAWVEIDAGIDINPAALTLPSVPLTG
jgi:hypothetical protein